MRRVGVQAQAMAIGVSVLVGTLAWWLAPKGLDVRVWQPLCEAAHLRPPQVAFPGLWRVLVSAGVKFFGLPTVAAALKLLGPIALGFIAYFAMNSMHALLSLLLRTENCRADFRDLLIPGLIAAGVGLFATSNPVFACAATFSPQTLTFLLFFLVFDFLRRFFTDSDLVRGFIGFFLLGVLVAEGGLGLFLLVTAFFVGVLRIQRDQHGTFVMSNPSVYHVMKWLVTADFFVGLAAMLLVNFGLFGRWGGEFSFADLTGYFGSLGIMSIAVPLAMVVAPLVITVGSLPQATDNYSFLSYFRGVLLVSSGVASLVFLLMPQELTARNETLQMVLDFGSAFNLMAVMVAVTVEIYCRNHRVVFLRQQGLESHEVPSGPDGNVRFPLFVRRSAYLVMVALLVGTAALSLTMDGTRRLAGVVETAVADLTGESEGLACLFTDGALDAGVELKAALSGRQMLCHSMLDDRDPYCQRLRCRGLKTGEEYRLMEIGASVVLGDWAMQTNSVSLRNCGLQLGFEIWQRVRRPLPDVGWLLARPAGFPSEARAALQAAAEDFAGRVLAGEYAFAYRHTPNPRLRELFDTVVFRTAQMIGIRARVADRRGETDEATRLLGVSRKLNAANLSYDRMMGFLNLVWNRNNLQLTPREALRVALERANFKAAKPHAEAILTTEPDNHFAHFALGMYHYLERNYPRADIHLSAALKVMPKEPTLLNNLAIVRMYLGKLEEAETLAETALKVRPGTPEIKATLKEIRTRLKSAK